MHWADIPRADSPFADTPWATPAPPRQTTPLPSACWDTSPQFMLGYPPPAATAADHMHPTVAF